MKDGDLLIFPHITKTGGTAFVDFVKNKFAPDEVLVLDYKVLKIDPDGGNYIDFRKVAFDYLRSIPNKKLDRIKFLTGHALPFGVHKFFNKKAKYITFIRDPVSRVVSLYNYFRTLQFREKFWLKKKKLYQNILLINGKVPTFSSWVENKFGDKIRLFSLGTQSNYLKALGYKLPDFDYIGENIELMGLPHKNVSWKFVKKIDTKTKGILNLKLKDDFLLYNKIHGIHKTGDLVSFLGWGLKGKQ